MLGGEIFTNPGAKAHSWAWKDRRRKRAGHDQIWFYDELHAAIELRMMVDIQGGR